MSSEVQSLIMEIRAGAGGDEAGLFVVDLFKMYSGYTKNQGWGFKVLNQEPTPIGGYKELSLEIEGRRVFDKLKNEAGVHRVQRIPETERKGRIHTSTATVVVLPKAKPRQVQLKRSDVKIESFPSSGPGGQYTNRRETAVRVTHKKTGITATCQSARSQSKNKINAVRILQAKLLQRKHQKLSQKRGQKRLSQMGGGKRANKIRTYNFPQNRVTDHRIKKTWNNLEEIMDGNLELIIKKLSTKTK